MGSSGSTSYTGNMFSPKLVLFVCVLSFIGIQAAPKPEPKPEPKRSPKPGPPWCPPGFPYYCDGILYGGPVINRGGMKPMGGPEWGWAASNSKAGWKNNLIIG